MTTGKHVKFLTQERLRHAHSLIKNVHPDNDPNFRKAVCKFFMAAVNMRNKVSSASWMHEPEQFDHSESRI